MAVRTAYAPVAATVLTATNLAKLPGGWIGYNEVTANQGSVGTTATDWTGLAVSVTVGTGRRIKITVQGGLTDATAAAQQAVALYVREGATTLGAVFQVSLAASASAFGTGTVVLTPTPGAHTYKVSGNFTAGSGNTFAASATTPAFILVEDIGATP